MKCITNIIYVSHTVHGLTVIYKHSKRNAIYRANNKATSHFPFNNIFIQVLIFGIFK